MLERILAETSGMPMEMPIAAAVIATPPVREEAAYEQGPGCDWRMQMCAGRDADEAGRDVRWQCGDDAAFPRGSR